MSEQLKRPVPPQLTPWKKGQSGNPLGGSLKVNGRAQFKRLTAEAVEEMGSLILEGDIKSLVEIRDNPESTVLKMWLASIATRAIERGDPMALSVLLDRITGPVKQKIEATIEARETNLETLSVEELEKLKELVHKVETPDAG